MEGGRERQIDGGGACGAIIVISLFWFTIGFLLGWWLL